jgi:hypothetical protein
MAARYAMGKHQWLEACQVAPERFDHVMPRLSTLMAPWVEPLPGQPLTQPAQTYGSGLRSDVERQNVAAIA